MKSEMLTGTANVRAMLEQLGTLRTRQKGVPCLGAVIGAAGLGKTSATQWYATNHGARYLVANTLWTPNWMLNELYDTIVNGVSSGSGQLYFRNTQRAFSECLHRLQTDRAPIILDEADRVANSTNHLETLRDLSDRTGTPIIFVGTEMVLRRLVQREQFSSRLSQVVSFKRLEIEEIQMIARKLVDLELDQEAAQALLDKSRGYFRDCVVAITHLERAAKASRSNQVSAELVATVAERALRRAA